MRVFEKNLKVNANRRKNNLDLTVAFNDLHLIFSKRDVFCDQKKHMDD